MSSNSPNPVAKWAPVLITGLIFIIICIALWLGPVSAIGAVMAKYVSDRGDSSSLWYDFPNWIQPNDAWHKWVGYPEKFSNVAGFVTIGSTITDTLTNKTVKNCMLECAGKKKDCVGFQYNSSNTCTLFSGIGQLFPSSTSNVVYSKSDQIPTKSYSINNQKMPPAVVPITITSAHTMKSGNLRIKSITTTNNRIVVTTFDPHGLDISTPITLYGTGIFNFAGQPASSTYYQIPATAGITMTENTIEFNEGPPASTYAGNLPALADGDTSGRNGYIYTETTPSTAADSIVVKTSAAHGFSAGQTANVFGMSSSSTVTFNNVFTISTVLDDTTFVVPVSKATVLGLQATGGSVKLVSNLKEFILPTKSTSIECAQVCSSNTSCLAFTFDTASRKCSQLTNDPGDLITANPTTIGTFIIGSAPTFQSSSKYY